MTTYGITGASGGLGRRTAEYLLDHVAAADLVLFSRTPASLAEYADRGATVRAADFGAPDTLAEAFAGVDVLLLISTDAVGGRTEQHLAAIAAAEAAGVTRVVYTSMLNPSVDSPVGILGAEHFATEAALRASGLRYTFLRNAFYFEAISGGWGHAASTGHLVSTTGAGRHAPILRDDCAAVAAAVLIGDGHDDATYDIVGARLLDSADIAGALTMVAGTPVVVDEVDDSAYGDILASSGLPAEAVTMVVGIGALIRSGAQEVPLGDVERLLGRPPVSIEDFAPSVLATQDA